MGQNVLDHDGLINIKEEFICKYSELKSTYIKGFRRIFRRVWFLTDEIVAVIDLYKEVNHNGTISTTCPENS